MGCRWCAEDEAKPMRGDGRTRDRWSHHRDVPERAAGWTVPGSREGGRRRLARWRINPTDMSLAAVSRLLLRDAENLVESLILAQDQRWRRA
jgi:hypothetical protein